DLSGFFGGGNLGGLPFTLTFDVSAGAVTSFNSFSPNLLVTSTLAINGFTFSIDNTSRGIGDGLIGNGTMELDTIKSDPVTGNALQVVKVGIDFPQQPPPNFATPFVHQSISPLYASLNDFVTGMQLLLDI